MLYGTTIKINEKIYNFKIGMGEFVELEDQGINLSEFENGVKIKELLMITYTAIANNNKFKMDFKDFIVFIDESDLTIDNLSKTIEQAIDLGMNKIKKQKKIKKQQII